MKCPGVRCNEQMQLGLSAYEAMGIDGSTVYLRGDGRTEIYGLAYVRLLIPYLAGERHSPGMSLVHFRPGMKPWLSLSTIEDDGEDPSLKGVLIYSGLGTYREMGIHLDRSQALRMAQMLSVPRAREHH